MTIQTIEISGVEIRRRGDKAELLVRYEGTWRLVASEYLDGQFGHAVSPAGIRNSPLDPMVDEP